MVNEVRSRGGATPPAQEAHEPQNNDSKHAQQAQDIRRNIVMNTFDF
jgi:hypothetical protein